MSSVDHTLRPALPSTPAARAEPLVSIIVTNYNYGAFLLDAVRSAVNQDYRRTEIIVVDDGSTDDSIDRLTPYLRSKAITLLQSPHVGRIRAVNLGFELSAGDLVLFLDADDFLLPSAVRLSVAAIREGVVKVQFPLIVVDRDGRRLGLLPRQKPSLSSAEIRALTLSQGVYPTPPTSGNLYTRAYLNIVMPIDPDMVRRAPDGVWNTLAPLYGAVVPLPVPLGCYRLHGPSLSQAESYEMAKMIDCVAVAARERDLLFHHMTLLGIAPPDTDPLDHSFFVLNKRLAILKSAPAGTSPNGDTAGRLVALTVRSISLWEPALFWRMIEIIWFAAMAALPRRVARVLLPLRQRLRLRMNFGLGAAFRSLLPQWHQPDQRRPHA